MAAGLAVFFMTVVDHRRNKRAWLWLGLTAVFIGVTFLAWTRYENRVYTRAELPLVDLRLSGDEMSFWYFGDLKYRLRPDVWLRGGWRVLTGLFGSFALSSVLLVGLLWRPYGKIACAWLAGGLISAFIFFHIVLAHSHYYLMFVPPVALLCGPIMLRLEESLTPLVRSAALSRCILIFALVLSSVQGLMGAHVICYFDKYPQVIAALIRQYTSPSDKLVIQGGGWGGQMLFLSDRRGWSVWNAEPLEDPKIYARLKELGFTKLVMISDSPLLSAVEHQTSTSPTVDRNSYRSKASPIVEQLPTVLQTEDILIKELP